MKLTLVLIVFSSAAGLARAADDGTFLLRGATVHTMAGRDISNGAVLVRDGKIAGVGQNLSAPDGVRVIDASGLQVYPGMIDSYSDTGLTEIEMVRESNDEDELGLFNPELKAWMAVNPSSEHIPVVRANGITTSVAVPNGQLVAGMASMIHLNGWTTDDMAVNRTLALHINIPAIQTHTYHFPEGPVNKPYEDAKKDRDQKMQQLTDYFDEARRYAKAKQANAPGFKEDLKLEAMIPVLDGKVPVIITAEREREIKLALDFAEKEKLRMILAGGAEAWKVTGELKAHHIPVVLQPTLSLPMQEDDPYDQPFATPGALYNAGVLFSFSTMSAQFGRNLPYQAAAAVPFGLPREAAMAAVTINAARIYGMDKQIGSIEEGKVADLFITDGDPLETNTQVKQLFIAGRPVDLENKQVRLYEKYRSKPEPGSPAK